MTFINNNNNNQTNFICSKTFIVQIQQSCDEQDSKAQIGTDSCPR